MSYPMGMPRESTYPGSIPDYSPHQWQSHDIAGGPFVQEESAEPDIAAAQAAVAAAGANRDGSHVLSVPNMSYPGTHRMGD